MILEHALIPKESFRTLSDPKEVAHTLHGFYDSQTL